MQVPPGTLQHGETLPLPQLAGDTLEMDITFDPGDPDSVFGITVFASPDGREQTDILYSLAEQAFTVDVERATLDPTVRYHRYAEAYIARNQLSDAEAFTTRQVAPFALQPGQPLQLRIFLDRSVIEIFANDRLCITQRVYPTLPDSTGIHLFCKHGSVRYSHCCGWKLHPTNSW